MLNYGTAYPAECDLISKENFVIISNSKPLWKVQNMLDHVFIRNYLVDLFNCHDRSKYSDLLYVHLH